LCWQGAVTGRSHRSKQMVHLRASSRTARLVVAVAAVALAAEGLASPPSSFFVPPAASAVAVFVRGGYGVAGEGVGVSRRVRAMDREKARTRRHRAAFFESRAPVAADAWRGVWFQTAKKKTDGRSQKKKLTAVLVLLARRRPLAHHDVLAAARLLGVRQRRVRVDGEDGAHLDAHGVLVRVGLLLGALGRSRGGLRGRRRGGGGGGRRHGCGSCARAESARAGGGGGGGGGERRCSA
jgi:hypothetical protein